MDRGCVAETFLIPSAPSRGHDLVSFENRLDLSDSLVGMDKSGFIKLAMYDVSGREVKTLVEGMMTAGKHTINVEVGDLAPGVYFYQLTASGNSVQKRMILLK